MDDEQEKKRRPPRGLPCQSRSRCAIFAVLHLLAVMCWLAFHVARQAPHLESRHQRTKWRQARLAQNAMWRQASTHAIPEGQTWRAEVDDQPVDDQPAAEAVHSAPAVDLSSTAANMSSKTTSPTPAPTPAGWVPTDQPRVGPISIRCLGNLKYLSVSSRGQVSRML
jgi:hypothetical protein